MALARWMVWTVVSVCLAGAGWGQATAPSSVSPAKPGAPEPVVPTTTAPIPSNTPGVTPPELPSGKTQISAGKHHGDTHLSKAQQDQLIGDLDNIFHFVSKDTGLAISHPIKHAFQTREDIGKYLRKKFDEDKDTKRMERSELVLKKFGLLDRDFQLRPFLLSLLTEQIAGFYDDKTKTMNLLDWVPMDEQKPVMAHELTHALQDQHVDLSKWEDQGHEGIARNATEDREHIETDETDTARQSVLEGEAMVTFADYALSQNLKPGEKAVTLRDIPELPDQLKNAGGDTSDSPVMARAPLLLQQSLIFPYTSGLVFEHCVLLRNGTQAAFAGTIDNPPNSTAEILHPDQYLAHTPEPVLRLPDIHPLLESEGYAPYDVGVMGEFDVRILAELFGGRPLAEALAPDWAGGVYYAAQKKTASEAEKSTTASIALLYESDWKNEDSARSFFRVFEEQLPRQYDGIKRREKDEAGNDIGADERVYSTREGDVFLAISGTRVWVSEGFPLEMSRNLRGTVEGAQGSGPLRVAQGRERGDGSREQGDGSREQGAGRGEQGGSLLGGLAGWIGGFGMMRAALGR